MQELTQFIYGLCFGGGLVVTMSAAFLIEALTRRQGRINYQAEMLAHCKTMALLAGQHTAQAKRAADAEEMRNQILIRQMAKEQGLQVQMIQACEKPQCQCTKCVAIRNIFKNGGLPPNVPPGNPGNN